MKRKKWTEMNALEISKYVREYMEKAHYTDCKCNKCINKIVR